MNKILVTGKNGQVGWELQRTLSTLGTVIAVDRQEMDLAHPESLTGLIRRLRPNIIVNTAAYTAVDKAESESELAMAINGIAPGILAEEAKRLDALLVHYSTDYIFNGCSKTPYGEQDIPDPLNIYGRTKLAGDEAIQSIGGKYLILRTSWVYGTRGKNFLLTMLKLASERNLLKIVNDQIGAPTWSNMIALATAQILLQDHEKWGIYNLTSDGETSWCDFAKEIFRTYSSINPAFKVPEVLGIPSIEYPTPAKRPNYSKLSNDKIYKTFNLKMPLWNEALQLCLRDIY